MTAHNANKIKKAQPVNFHHVFVSGQLKEPRRGTQRQSRDAPGPCVGSGGVREAHKV